MVSGPISENTLIITGATFYIDAAQLSLQNKQFQAVRKSLFEAKMCLRALSINTEEKLKTLVPSDPSFPLEERRATQFKELLKKAESLENKLKEKLAEENAYRACVIF